MITWRFIDTGALDGPDNMAMDEALLASFDPAQSLPVFRLYGWDPPALSIGRFQDAAGVLDLGRCASAGVPVVRRVTGGGVIYHADELTYSLVCSPAQLPAVATIKESFRALTAFLLRFYKSLGIDACHACDLPSAGDRLGVRAPFCFAGKEEYDILAGGRKIGGNAQRRLKNVIFQHGSIPSINRAGIGAAFLREPPAEIMASTTSLVELGVTDELQRLRELLAAAFAGSLGIDLLPCGLSPDEELLATALRRDKYFSDEWNLHGLLPVETNL